MGNLPWVYTEVHQLIEKEALLENISNFYQENRKVCENHHDHNTDQIKI
jgi:hypothetical protein